MLSLLKSAVDSADQKWGGIKNLKQRIPIPYDKSLTTYDFVEDVIYI